MPHIANTNAYCAYRKYKTSSKIVSVGHADNTVSLKWNDGEISEFDEVWLHDNCYCKKCLHPTTRERLTHFTEKQCPSISTMNSDTY
ncbi:gamma-butyrobetaine hydroxylase-like domain-containing protein [Candidatus Spongiihabitans sp.]|uniref:gamma-butyrobetaine hydroxylase-like domain-containing protein n=1 Tax=Candidatus Spongiihabitans sp. TaxID=3101308 RepID=UPI003C6EDD4A